MRPASLARFLTIFSFDLLEAGVALDANPHIEKKSPGHVSRVSWKDEDTVVPLLRETVDASIDRYLSILEHRGYSAVLSDGGVLQLSYEFRHATITSHRLCFFPCPVQLTDAEAAEYPIADRLREMTPEELRERFRLRTPLRFEYDPKNAAAEHPSSHLHLMHDSCRVPVRSYMDPSTFLSFIFRNFYSQHWINSVSQLDTLTSKAAVSLSAEEKQLPHINWVYST